MNVCVNEHKLKLEHRCDMASMTTHTRAYPTILRAIVLRLKY